jgi:trk system potassium uptake protein
MRVVRVLAGLGTIFRLFSISLIVPILASLWWDPKTNMIPLAGLEVRASTIGFVLVLVIILLLGFLLTSIASVQLEELREREGFAIVGFAWLLLAALGAIPFLLTKTTRDPVAAYFETMSGLTATGATAFDLATFDAILPSVHVWRATLHAVGGLGVIVLAVAVFARLTEAGQRLMAAETPGGQATRLKPTVTQTAAALWNVYFAFVVVLFGTLWIAMHFTGRHLSWKDSALDALITSFSTVSTGGFSNRADSIAFYQSGVVSAVVTLFMLASGVNFNLYWHFFHGRRNRLFADSEFRFFLGIFLVSAAAIAAVLILNGSEVSMGTKNAAFYAASFMTSSGLTIADHNAFPEAAKMVLLLLMFTGGCVGSTAGGLKLVRVLLLARLTRRELEKLLHPHAVATLKVEGRVIPEDTLRRVVVFFFAYVTLVLVGAFLFAFTGLGFMSAVSASATLVGNVGPAFDRAAYSFFSVPDLGKLIGIFLMWMGRLEIFTAVVLLFPRTYRD